MAYCCPNCGSRDIMCVEEGYNIRKGLLGYFAFGAIGSLFGLHGSKRLVWRCPCCNRCFDRPAYIADIGESYINTLVEPQEPVKKQQKKKPLARSNSTPPVVKQRIVCSCGAYNSVYAKTCFSCGAEISLADSTKVPELPKKVVVCKCGAKNALTHRNCMVCGAWLDYKLLEQQDGNIVYNEQQCQHCGQNTPAKSRKVKYCAHCGKPL